MPGMNDTLYSLSLLEMADTSTKGGEADKHDSKKCQVAEDVRCDNLDCALSSL